jgi:hypothetical protein
MRLLLVGIFFLFSSLTSAEENKKSESQPFRTFITLESYVMEANGEPGNPISEVRLEIAFPNNVRVELPGGSQYWPIGNGQTQAINRTYEVPASALVNDGFNFNIQMVRKGAKFLPCQFSVTQISEYNRTYFCHTDLQWQTSQKIPTEKINKEGIRIKVSTDKNTPKNELPKEALALKR